MTQQESKSYRYDAFISYRHVPRDGAIASALLKRLEALPLKGRKKFHVFRDREEFPTSSNLGDSIHQALEESEFLILICSPEYLKSEWCREELLYFRKLHGDTNRNILPILASGEPTEAFPKELFTQVEERIGPDGAVEQYTRQIEPLGADVRADTIRKALKALADTEYLRLAAAMLNCHFDDLYRREQRRQRKKLALAATGIAAAAAVMISFLLWQLFQVKQAQLHEQLTYAQQLFSSADRLRSRESCLDILEDHHWPMEAGIQEQAEKLEFLTGYTPQFSVVTTICPSLSEHQVFFGPDGGSVLEWDYTRLIRYSLEGEELSRFSLGTKGQKISAVSPDGTRAAILRMEANGVQKLELWDTEAEVCLGTLLDCALVDAAEGLQADFNADGTVLSVCRMGGYSNSNDRLCLFEARTGRELCSLDGALLGTLAEDGVTERVVEAFSFLNSDVAHWTGSGYEVFYSLSQNTVRRVSRNWASRYARVFSGCSPALGRYAVLETSSGVELWDLAQMGQDDFQQLLRNEAVRAKPVQMLNAALAAFAETETQSSLFSGKKEVLSRFWVCDLTDPERVISVEELSRNGWSDPVFYASESSSVVYLSVTGEQQAQLLRIDLDKRETVLIPQAERYQQLLFLGSVNGQDFFAGDTGEKTVLLSVNREGTVRARAVELSLRQLEGRYDLAATQGGVCLVGEYQGNYCLFSMESKAERLDAFTPGKTAKLSVSADGSRWLCWQGREIIGSCNGTLDGLALQDDICYAGVGLNGNAFVASTKQIMAFHGDGSQIFSLTQSEERGIFDAIRSAKLSESGAYLYWLTSPSVSGTGSKRNTCRLHSLELASGKVTEYYSGVFWPGDLPAEHMYDCSPDGEQVVFLSDTVIPELRLLHVNQPSDWKRAEASPFDTLNLPTNKTLTGVAYGDPERIVCTAGSSVAIVDGNTLEAIRGISEQSPSEKLPQLWPDGTLVYFGSNLDFWDLSTGELVSSISADDTAELVRSQDGKWFVITDTSGTVLYDAETRTPADLLSSSRLTIHLLTADCTVFSHGSHLYRLDFSEYAYRFNSANCCLKRISQLHWRIISSPTEVITDTP